MASCSSARPSVGPVAAGRLRISLSAKALSTCARRSSLTKISTVGSWKARASSARSTFTTLVTSSRADVRKGGSSRVPATD
eukprot:scaffold417_cov388-Prasinococcus_capsulatus_cf.AAC.4